MGVGEALTLSVPEGNETKQVVGASMGVDEEGEVLVHTKHFGL